MYQFIKSAAYDVGFDACGVAKTETLVEDEQFLQTWLGQGKHADMHYLSRNVEKRTNPCLLVPGCKSVVVVLLNYFPAEKQKIETFKIAKYAYGQNDYHFVLKSKLKELENRLMEKYGEQIVSQTNQHSFVDSAPVFERRWAQKAGLGWLGKNKQLIHPEMGSFCFIGILMLNVELEKYDEPTAFSRCGNCTACLDACPTKALSSNGFDARKCLSYQTIENKNEIPIEIQEINKNIIFGCDICNDVCPWNIKNAKPNKKIPMLEILNWNDDEWKILSKTIFNTCFHGSALERAGYKKLRQNIENISNRK